MAALSPLQEKLSGIKQSKIIKSGCIASHVLSNFNYSFQLIAAL
jgi:hypothetical protein